MNRRFLKSRSLQSLCAVAGATAAALALATPVSATPVSILDASTAPETISAAQDSLSQRLGGAFANSWLDSQSGRLVVGITDAARAGVVRAAGAVPKVVTHSAAALSADQSSLDRKAGVPDSVTGWYVDAAANQVVVEVLNNDAAGVAWAKSSGLGSLRVDNTAHKPTAMWDIIGGQAINFSGGRCSVGFSARNASAQRFVITAGHCTELGGNVTGTGGAIGTVAGTSFPNNDYGIIRVTSAAAVSTALVDRWSSGSDVTVAGRTVTPVGGAICRSGSTTGWRCGTVGAFNQTVNYGGGDVVNGLTRTSACAQPGDSGGSYVSNPGSGTRVQAQGVLSGGSGNCSVGGTTFFQPLNEILSAYSLTLVTG